MLEVLQWLGYVLLYLLNPDEIASDVIANFGVSWWVHELLLFAHHALLVAAEGLLIVLAFRHPRPFLALWHAIRWLWYRIRQAIRWLGKALFHRHIRMRSLANHPPKPTNGKHLNLTDMFWTSATPFLAKLAPVAMVWEWRQYRWAGFLAVWLGGCLRLVAYPFIGKWVYAIILLYALIRWRRYVYWVFQWLRQFLEKVGSIVP